MPTEEKINLIIGHTSKKYALIYSIIKECGLRPVEIGNLTLNDIDLERGVLSVETAKHGKARVLKLKRKTLSMLIEYVKSGNFNVNDKIFPPSSARASINHATLHDSNISINHNSQKKTC